MAVIFIDGFDKYGPAGLNNGNLLQTLLQQEWTIATSGSQVVAGLSAVGQAVTLTGNLSKTLPTSYSRLIGGIRFAATLALFNSGITLTSTASSQVSISINANTGTISIRTGSTGGTQIETTLSSVNAGSTHYLEWDIAIGSSASYEVWLDGVSILSGTGNTNPQTTGTVDGIVVAGGDGLTVDDLYVFDSSGSTNNAVLLSSPRVETTTVTADVQTQFAFGAGVLGASGAYRGNNSFAFTGNNALLLRKYIPQANCTLTSVACLPLNSSAFAKFKGVIYHDNAGTPVGQSLMTTGNEVIGTIGGSTVTSTFGSPPSLIASTAYWIGFIMDTSLEFGLSDSDNFGVSASNTYVSGAPATCPAVSLSQPSWVIYGNVTGISLNWLEEANNPSIGDLSYVVSETVGNEDLYSFNSLSVTPLSIYTVCAKALVRKTDTGIRTVDVRLKSGASDSAGSNPSIVPGTSYNWEDSFFDTDPNTGLPWDASGLNAASSGLKVAS